MSAPERPSRRAPLALCYGTRPQVIKASVLLDALQPDWDLLTVDTGQHYTYELNALLYEQLGVRAPDVWLDVGSADHAIQTGDIMRRAAAVFSERGPWAVIVIGDTNSTLGCALAAAKMRIPVVHVEAGLRAADAYMAEEINRRAVDAFSSVLCAPSAAAEARLRAEHAAGTIVRTGDVARDVLERNAARLPALGGAEWWPLDAGAPFVMATLHRAELTDDPARLARAVAALEQLDLPVVLAAHPRTQARLREGVITARVASCLHVVDPLGYLETLAAIGAARGVVTDSGGVQREAYWLGTPCVTLRDETEWRETVELGANALFSPDRDPSELGAVLEAQIDRLQRFGGWDRSAYGDGDAGGKIRHAIRSFAEGRGSV